MPQIPHYLMFEFDKVATIAMQLGYCSLLAKIDIKSAYYYCLIPVHSMTALYAMEPKLDCMWIVCYPLASVVCLRSSLQWRTLSNGASAKTVCFLFTITWMIPW